MLNERILDELDRCLHDIFIAMQLDHAPICEGNRNFSIKNLSLMETRILRYVAEKGMIPLKDIRAMVMLPNSTLTSIVKRFEEKGLIERLPNPEDKRSFILKVTEKGILFNNQHRDIDKQIASNFMERLDRIEDVETFIRIVNKATKQPLISIENFCNEQLQYPEKEKD